MTEPKQSFAVKAEVDAAVKQCAIDGKMKTVNVGGVEVSLCVVVQKTRVGSIITSWLVVSRKNGIKIAKSLGKYAARKDPKHPEALTLDEARKDARRFLSDLEAGKDPKAKPVAVKPSCAKAADKPQTIAELVPKWLDAKQSSERAWNPRLLKDYTRLLNNHVLPTLGKMTPEGVTAEDVKNVVVTVYKKQPSTGGKILMLIRGFMAWCLNPKNNFRSPLKQNPADHSVINNDLPPSSKLPNRHHPMCNPNDVPRFVKWLVDSGRINTAPGIACLFLLLTAVRKGNVFFDSNSTRRNYAEWKDFDLSDPERPLWTIPDWKMKAKGNGCHEVPLSKQAVALLQRLQRLGFCAEDAVFVTSRGNPVSSVTTSLLIKDASAADLAAGNNGFVDQLQGGKRMTIHGFRSSFRVWGSSRMFEPWLLEEALHHTSDKLRHAYDRTQQPEARRPIMQQWADYCFGLCPSNWDDIGA